jgi:hypothetical protein
MTDAQAPLVPPSVNRQPRHEASDTLTGDFQFDLPLRDSAAACTRAIEGLGWPNKAVDTNHIVSYADTASAQHPPMVEVELHGSGPTTDLRITGTNSDAGPHQRDALIVELDRVRDAIKAEAEAIENSAAQAPAADWSSDPLTASPPVQQQMPPPVMPPPVNGHQQRVPVAEPPRVEQPPLPPTKKRRGKGLLIGLIVLGLLVLFGAAAGVVLKIQHDNNVAAQQEKAAAQAKERQEARAAIRNCQQQLKGLDNALTDVSGRLNVGLTFSEYSTRVGDANAAYGRTDFTAISGSCANNAGIPLENAMNDYTTAARVWNTCYADLYCSDSQIDPMLQRKWTQAEVQIEQAHSGYSQVTPGGSGSVAGGSGAAA